VPVATASHSPAQYHLSPGGSVHLSGLSITQPLPRLSLHFTPKDKTSAESFGGTGGGRERSGGEPAGTLASAQARPQMTRG